MKTFLPSLAILFLIQLTSTAAIGQDLISLQRKDSKTVSAMVYRFALSVKTVLVGWRGQEVSFNTTVGGVGALLKIRRVSLKHFSKGLTHSMRLSILV